MEKWVLSIVGTVALGVLLDIIMPEGDMSKYIKGVFAIVVITVVIAPLPTFFLSIKNGHIIPPEYSGNINVDTSFVEYVDDEEIRSIESKIGKILMKYEVNYSKITINDEKRDNYIDEVRVYIEDLQDREKVIDIMNNNIGMRIKEVIVIGGKSS